MSLIQDFMDNRLGILQEKCGRMAVEMRGLFIRQANGHINSLLHQYFLDFRAKNEQERVREASGSNYGPADPANVSSPILQIVKFLHHDLLVQLGLDFRPVYEKLVSNLDSVNSFLERAQKPELLTPSKKFSQMEMEMDKFLAKKSLIYNKLVFQPLVVPSKPTPPLEPFSET
jgi:hypothetical protein